MRVLPVQVFFEEKRQIYDLELLTESAESTRPITAREINRPGMCLAGYTGNFLDDRIQILGETEILYLRTLSKPELQAAIDRLFQFQLICILICKKLDPPGYMIQRANERRVPVIRTPQSTTPFLHSLTDPARGHVQANSIDFSRSIAVRYHKRGREPASEAAFTYLPVRGVYAGRMELHPHLARAGLWRWLIADLKDRTR